MMNLPVCADVIRRGVGRRDMQVADVVRRLRPTHWYQNACAPHPLSRDRVWGQGAYVDLPVLWLVGHGIFDRAIGRLRVIDFSSIRGLLCDAGHLGLGSVVGRKECVDRDNRLTRPFVGLSGARC